MRAAALLVLAACVDTAEPAPSPDAIVTYDCALNHVCDDDGSDVTFETYTGTLDEIQATIDVWVDACNSFAVREVEEGVCARVVCGAICYPEDR